MELENLNTSEVHYLEADQPTDEFRVISPRQSELEYSVEHHGDQFFIVTNAEAVNFKLMRASVNNPSRKMGGSNTPSGGGKTRQRQYLSESSGYF